MTPSTRTRIYSFMEKLGSLVHHRLNAHQVGSAATAAEIMNAANQLLTHSFSFKDHSAKAFRFERGNLFIRAENAVIGQELWGIKHLLLKTLQEKFGPKTLLRITVKWFDNSQSQR